MLGFLILQTFNCNVKQLGAVSIRINCLEKPIFLFVYCQAPFFGHDKQTHSTHYLYTECTLKPQE